jgi:hypothetical protein
MLKISQIKPEEKLFFLLKSCPFVSDDFISYIASANGISAETLVPILDRLHKLQAQQHQEIRHLKGQLQLLHYRYMAYLKQFETLPLGVVQREIIRTRLERAYSLYNTIKQQLTAFKRMGNKRCSIESCLTEVQEQTED